MGVTELVCEYNHSKVKLRLFLTCCTVAMVTHYVEEMAITCSPILLLFLVSLLHQLIKSGSIDSSKRTFWKVMDTSASHLKCNAITEF